MIRLVECQLSKMMNGRGLCDLELVLFKPATVSGVTLLRECSRNR